MNQESGRNYEKNPWSQEDTEASQMAAQINLLKSRMPAECIFDAGNLRPEDIGLLDVLMKSGLINDALVSMTIQTEDEGATYYVVIDSYDENSGNVNSKQHVFMKRNKDKMPRKAFDTWFRNSGI